jgi:hypothetical protein
MQTSGFQKILLYGTTGMTSWLVIYSITIYFYSNIFWFPPVFALIVGFASGLFLYWGMKLFYYENIQKTGRSLIFLNISLIFSGFVIAFILGLIYSGQNPYGSLFEVWVRRRMPVAESVHMQNAVYSGLFGGILPNLLMIFTLNIIPDKNRLVTLILIIEIFLCVSVPLVCSIISQGID